MKFSSQSLTIFLTLLFSGFFKIFLTNRIIYIYENFTRGIHSVSTIRFLVKIEHSGSSFQITSFLLNFMARFLIKFIFQKYFLKKNYDLSRKPYSSPKKRVFRVEKLSTKLQQSKFFTVRLCLTRTAKMMKAI